MSGRTDIDAILCRWHPAASPLVGSTRPVRLRQPLSVPRVELVLLLDRRVASWPHGLQLAGFVANRQPSFVTFWGMEVVTSVDLAPSPSPAGY